jgi:hypothetical protein
MIIYVAGKYSANTKKEIKANVKGAIEAGLMIMQKGHVPIVPHLSHYMDKMAAERGFSVHWETWIAMCFNLIDRCDALFVLSESPGANAEIAYARKRNIPVYRNFDAIQQEDNCFSGSFPFRIDIV